MKSPYCYKRSAIHLDKIVFEPNTDAPTALAALQSGDVQALTAVDPTEVAAVQASPNLRIVSAPQMSRYGVITNIGNHHGVGNVGNLPYSNLGTPLASSAKLAT